MIAKMAAKELKAYGKAGAVAEEAISTIRTVLCYNGQEREIQRFRSIIKKDLFFFFSFVDTNKI